MEKSEPLFSSVGSVKKPKPREATSKFVENASSFTIVPKNAKRKTGPHKNRCSEKK
jgi:hypothetical protein